MQGLLYHASWIAVALALIAGASAWLSHHWRLRETRRHHAEEALDALARYSEWLAGQRRPGQFSGERTDAAAPLARVRTLQQASFPELAPALVHLYEVHARLLDFLWRQQLLQLRDPEGWLESDHDGRFMALWREHREVVHALAQTLRRRAGELLVDAEPESVYPA
ncbi:hypothetical protein ACPWT1_22315 [Ramlibacter sp. MMS24-I3-19]|uniref:hypothetical protein n=1 Tax=Ramlibacter sp. MMS24-I3-19 TaxID=3416606 RepID=UPI003CFEAEFE